MIKTIVKLVSVILIILPINSYAKNINIEIRASGFDIDSVQIETTHYSTDDKNNSISFSKGDNSFKTVFVENLLYGAIPARSFKKSSAHAVGADVDNETKFPDELYFSATAIINFKLTGFPKYNKPIYACKINFGLGSKGGAFNGWIGVNEGRKLDHSDLETTCLLSNNAPDAPDSIKVIFNATSRDVFSARPEYIISNKSYAPLYFNYNDEDRILVQGESQTFPFLEDMEVSFKVNNKDGEDIGKINFEDGGIKGYIPLWNGGSQNWSDVNIKDLPYVVFTEQQGNGYAYYYWDV